MVGFCVGENYVWEMDWNRTRHQRVLPPVSYSFICSVYRPSASQWWMGWERSATFSPTTSRSGIGPWRLQPQVSIKWYIVNVPCYGFSGKTQQPYFTSVSFQNGNLIVSIIPFQWKLLIANIDTSDGSFSLPEIWDSSYIIKIYGKIVESFFLPS